MFCSLFSQSPYGGVSLCIDNFFLRGRVRLQKQVAVPLSSRNKVFTIGGTISSHQTCCNVVEGFRTLLVYRGAERKICKYVHIYIYIYIYIYICISIQPWCFVYRNHRQAHATIGGTVSSHQIKLAKHDGTQFICLYVKFNILGFITILMFYLKMYYV